MAQHEEQVEHNDAQEQLVLSYAHSFHFVHNEDNNEDADQHRFVPKWGLRKDLRICSYHAYKELIFLLATPTEDQVLSSLTNRELISRTYQSLGQSILSQAELLKRHDQLNSDYTGLYNRSEKVADSYRLPLDALMKISPNVPPLAVDDGVGPSVENNGDGSAKLSFPKDRVTRTTVDSPLKTAT
ncbi:hypothetical protein Tco_0091053 [Tanacetum coccineum]